MKRTTFVATCLVFAASAALAACGSSGSGGSAGSGGSGGSSGSAGAAGSSGASGSAGAAGVAEVVDCSSVTPAATVSIAVGSVPFAFDPATVSVSVGDAVQWTNNTVAPHTSTSGQSGAPPAPDGKWDTGTIAASGGTACVKFLAAGAYDYFCAIHTSMSGSVTVQ